MNLTKLTLLSLSTLILGACTNQPSSTPISPTTSEETFPSAVATQSYTLQEVATHSTPEDCWIVIDNQVYDVSNFGTKHAGGEAVYQGCGQDATTLFETRPMGSKTPHSDKARSFLPNFLIGPLSP